METATKRRLLSVSNTYTTDAHSTLAALTDINEESCALLGVKQNAIDNFQFRLLQGEQSSNRPEDEIKSFIALSYTWHSSAWKPHSSITTLQQNISSPLTPAMWAALLAQLQDHECFWIDQLCINQALEAEKIEAVGSMDMVYRSARKVVIALEDVALSTTDADIMCRYATSNEPKSQMPEDVLEKLASIFVKIATARWFDRAWCLHEFLVGRSHVFLVPIWRADGPARSESSSISIMRIDGPILVRIYEIFIEQDVKHQKASLDSLLNSRYFTGTKIDNIRQFFNHLRRLDLQEVFGSQEKLFGDGSFMHMFHQVFSHSSMYSADKISIILNAMRSGLYLKVSTPFSEDECLWLITLIAMAAGDSTTLTTNGSRAIEGEGLSRKNRHWIRVPSAGDQARRTGVFIIPRTTIDAKVVEDGLELEMLFLGSNLILTSPSQHYLSIARWLIDHRALCELSIDGQVMRIDTEADENIYASLRISYIQALACALACGKDWMLAYHAKSYVNLPGGFELQWNPLSKETFSQAIDWGLATVIEQDIGADLKETWQDGGTLMWADNVTQEPEEEDGTDFAEQSFIQLNHEEHIWYSLLLDFTETLVNFGLAVFSEHSGSEVEHEAWNVQICSIPEVSRFLTYAPATNVQEPFHLGMPKALWDDKYSWMSRLWLLHEEKFGSPSQRYSLRGKARLAGISPLPELRGKRVTVVETRT
ncbi:MAG: hypothetical protein LQ342_006198 [Letrouitia transgressa]|nr:MAG: hypothetical protein LQ342_006198 [Letrouitia transgressa]